MVVVAHLTACNPDLAGRKLHTECSGRKILGGQEHICSCTCHGGKYADDRPLPAAFMSPVVPQLPKRQQVMGVEAVETVASPTVVPQKLGFIYTGKRGRPAKVKEPQVVEPKKLVTSTPEDVKSLHEAVDPKPQSGKRGRPVRVLTLEEIALGRKAIALQQQGTKLKDIVSQLHLKDANHFYALVKRLFK